MQSSRSPIAAHTYVSRAALKLKHALDHFGLSPKGCDCLDIGASTGGFTKCCWNAARATSRPSMSATASSRRSSRDDPRVTLWEGLNARDLDLAHLQTPLQFIVVRCQLHLAQAGFAPGARSRQVPAPSSSHSSSRNSRPAVRHWARTASSRTSRCIRQICDDIASWLRAQAWRVIGLTPSPRRRRQRQQGVPDRGGEVSMTPFDSLDYAGRQGARVAWYMGHYFASRRFRETPSRARAQDERRQGTGPEFHLRANGRPLRPRPCQCGERPLSDAARS